MLNVSELLSVAKATNRVPVAESVPRGLINRGQINTVRISTRLFITPDELRRVFGDEYRPPTKRPAPSSPRP